MLTTLSLGSVNGTAITCYACVSSMPSCVIWNPSSFTARTPTEECSPPSISNPSRRSTTSCCLITAFSQRRWYPKSPGRQRPAVWRGLTNRPWRAVAPHTEKNSLFGRIIDGIQGLRSMISGPLTPPALFERPIFGVVPTRVQRRNVTTFQADVQRRHSHASRYLHDGARRVTYNGIILVWMPGRPSVETALLSIKTRPPFLAPGRSFAIDGP
jgi:hypothetical protein